MTKAKWLKISIILLLTNFSSGINIYADTYIDNGFTNISFGPIYSNTQTTLGTHANTGSITNDSMAIGGNAYAVDKNNKGGCLAIGTNAYVENTDSIAIGDVAINTGKGSIVIGGGGLTRDSGEAKAVVTGNGSIGMGQGVGVTGNHSIAMGAGALTSGDNSIALGYGTLVKENNVIGIGNRRMTQMADGTADTDGVNVKQLNAVKNSIKIYTAGSDISISSQNAISVNKNGAIEKENTGIVTGGTVYAVTNKLSNSLDTQKTQLTAATKRLSSLTSTISDLKDSIIDINTSVTSAIISSSATINGRLDTSLSNLSEDGKDSLRQFIRSEIKNIGTTNIAKSSISTLAMPAVYEGSDVTDTSKLDEFNKTVENKADLSYVNQELDKKADKAELEKVSTAVKDNTEKIGQNTKDIQNLKETKADVDASNINVSKYAEKLGTGKVEAGEANLVTGSTVFDAMEKKADLDYVNDGFNRMEGQMQEMNRNLTKDIARVGAGAAALAGLHPQEYDPLNKLDFAAGYGHYKNANATAIGMYYRPNAGTTISLASTIGNGDPMISAGLSFKIGYGKHVEKVIITKNDYDVIQTRMEEQDKKIKEMEETLKNIVRN